VERIHGFRTEVPAHSRGNERNEVTIVKNGSMSQLTAGSSGSRPTHTITHPQKDKC